MFSQFQSGVAYKSVAYKKACIYAFEKDICRLEMVFLDFARQYPVSFSTCAKKY